MKKHSFSIIIIFMTLLLIFNMESYSSNRPINISKLRELICEDDTSCSIDWVWIVQDHPFISEGKNKEA